VIFATLGSDLAKDQERIVENRFTSGKSAMNGGLPGEAPHDA
jgi:hypothetical protein